MYCCLVFFLFFFFKQKTAYEMRISDWSSDVCSSDLTFTHEYYISFHIVTFGARDCSASAAPVPVCGYRRPRRLVCASKVERGACGAAENQLCVGDRKSVV